MLRRLVILSLGAVLAAAPATAATFTVNVTGNGNDATPGDGICATGTGNCSLRAAIEEANALAGADTINFGIGTGVQTITLTSILPSITGPVTIDGRTQPGFTGTPLIIIDGNDVANDGLTLSAGSGGSTIRGLILRNFIFKGVLIEPGSDGNTIAGNYLGRLTPAGTDAGAGLENGDQGIEVQSANNTIGGTLAADRNVIAGNGTDGIQLWDPGATSNRIIGNYIGVDATGRTCLGNVEEGVQVWNASNNFIGQSGAGNVIGCAGTNHPGIVVLQNASGTVIQGNWIGTNSFGDALGNGYAGIDVNLGSSNTTIGGTAAGQGNVIAFNAPQGGVLITTGTGSSIRRNSIYSNTGLGIDLGANGVTANDAGDPDTGPNNYQNFPFLTGATTNGTSVNLTGSLNSAPSTTYRLEFFASTAADPSGYGEGQRYIFSTSVTTGATGNISFSLSFGASVAAGEKITATATDPSNNTSEFSAAVTAATTAVELMSFEATPAPAGVALSWRTASELRNLGFRLHRASAEAGPWTRITSALIPGLGSSPLGASYSFVDAGRVPGQRYYYRLEDVDAASASTFHGPVSAVAGAPAAGGDAGATNGGTAGAATSRGSCPSWVASQYGESAGPLVCTRHGDPGAVSLQVTSRTNRLAVLELRTGGFWAVHEADGTVRAFVPGFDTPAEPAVLALPLRRALVDAEVGRGARLVAAEGFDVRRFGGLRPAAAGSTEMVVSRDGTVHALRRARRGAGPPRGLTPDALARLAGTVFQGDEKSAVVELFPLRFDAPRGELVLATRLRVLVSFEGAEPGETGRGNRGRAPRHARGARTDAPTVLAQLYATQRGIHGLRFEDAFPSLRRGVRTASLRLQRDGSPVAFHVEPSPATFGPGSVLFFHVERAAASTDFSSEVAYELVQSADGLTMPVLADAPTGPAVRTAVGRAAFEVNRLYQPGLLEATDPWLWDAVVSGGTTTKGFSLERLDAASPRPAQVAVDLQGASESGSPVDHHIQVLVNGALAGEARFAGKRPQRLTASVPASLLREGANELAIASVADTGGTSYVFLDRFEVEYPQRREAGGGRFEASYDEAGVADVAGWAAPPVAVLDVTASETGAVTWVVPGGAGASARWLVDAGHRYAAAAAAGVLSPRVTRPGASTLRSEANQADYLLIAPAAFLAAAEPLVAQREADGLAAKAASLEEVATVFGHGAASGEAIRSFVSYAFHSWAKPSPRYVVLFGDASFDPRRFMASSAASPLPTVWGRTSYLRTALDPLIGAVNGDDALPDVAVGRLPATTVEQAEGLVAKLLAWEQSGQGLSGRVALVADNPDAGGDFEGDVEDIRASFLAGRDARVLKVGELGAGTRAAIQDAFDGGLSLVSYVGHGAAAVWASENVWNSWDAPRLVAQSRQPVLMTMDCLNGYFVAPSFESLAESLVKAEGRGAIAAFSPTGLSVDRPAHEYHRALVRQLTGGGHARLGDAVLAAQRDYAQTGLMPELLSIYHLFGDPAMKIR